MEMQKSINYVTHFFLHSQFCVLFLHQWCHLPDIGLLLPLDTILTRAGGEMHFWGMHLDSNNAVLAVMAKEHSNSGYSF